MLNGTLTIGNIQDVEGYCNRVIERHRPGLHQQTREDLLAYLIATTWELHQRHRPGTLPFSAYAHAQLPLRIVDWQRTRDGRTTWKFDGYTSRRPTRPTHASLDELGDTLPPSMVDDPAHRDTDPMRLLRDRDREGETPYPPLDPTPAHHAA